MTFFARRLWLVPVLSVLASSAGSSEPAQPRGPQVFYVRQTKGDDANSGATPEQAWRSLAKLGVVLQAGDTAHVGPGLYREQIVLANAGTADRPIRLIADASGKQTLDPSGVVMITGAESVDEAIFVSGSVPGVYRAPSPEGRRVWGVVEMDGSQYRYKKARDTPEHLKQGMSELDVVARSPSTFFYDLETKFVYIHTSDGNPPSQHEIELILRNNGIAVVGQPHVTVIGFVLRHMGSAGINFEAGSDFGMALDNTAYGCWQGVRVFGSTDVLVRGNTLLRNDNSGVYFANGAIRGHAVGNVAYENSKGLRWSSASDFGIAADNTAFANLENGISIERTDGIRISGNVLANNAKAQLSVRDGRLVSDRNCFEVRGTAQAIAQLGPFGRYDTLAQYVRAANQDHGSREGCAAVPAVLDLHRLHADSSSYAERVKELLSD